MNPYRLPRSIVPHRYTVALEPDLAAATFLGHVIIDANVNEAVEQIVLNAIELDIQAVKVAGEPAEFSLEAATERLVIHTAHAAGTTSIEVTFAGTLNDKLRGWYRSTFTDAEGNQHVIAASQMQSTDCRRAFPCFDEPDFKAVFDVTLIVQPLLMAISNGPEIDRTATESGKVAVRFAPTMPMSTYLVAFIVGPLEATAPVLVPRLDDPEHPIELRVVHLPGKGHLADFGLESGVFALGWFQQYYGIAYPTEKCDLIAIPDFAAGAMENLGCITFRENLLLADPTTATQMELETIADVVNHELAHMWFGDLVTMKWWNGIWLNEAFATFMQVACTADFRPEWQRWNAFSLERTVAFDVDSLANTRPVEFPVEAPDDCAAMFDVLTYQKGGALLRMLEQYLGADEFRRGVSHYLSSHEYGNTETSDLWDRIEESLTVPVPVRALMDSWIWQPGYPRIAARLDGNELVLTQQRFAFGDTDDTTVFVTPVHVLVDGIEHKVLLDGPEGRLELPSVDSMVVVNAGGHGFFRVAYDDTLRARLLATPLDRLTIVDRYNLVDDAWNEVIAGRLTAAEYLTFIEGFSGEREHAVWQAMTIGLRGVGRILTGDAYAAFQQRVAALVRPALTELGWSPVAGESDLRAKLRGMLASTLAVLGNDADAQQRCRDLMNQGADPELIAAATNVVASVGTDEEYDFYLQQFRTAATPQEQLRFMYALAEFPTSAQMERTLALCFSGEVRTQNAPFLLNRCIANRWHGTSAWQSVRQHWDEANAKFPDSAIVRMVDSVRLLTTPADVADVQSFFAEHSIPQAGKWLDQVLERQRTNAALRIREETRLGEALTRG